MEILIWIIAAIVAIPVSRFVYDALFITAFSATKNSSHATVIVLIIGMIFTIAVFS